MDYKIYYNQPLPYRRYREEPPPIEKIMRGVYIDNLIHKNEIAVVYFSKNKMQFDAYDNSLAILYDTSRWDALSDSCSSIRDNSLVIGYLEGENRRIGANYITGNSMLISYATGEGTKIGDGLEDNSIVIGYGKKRPTIGAYIKDKSTVIGYGKGKYSLIGYKMTGSSMVIGYTNGDESTIGAEMEDGIHNIIVGYSKGDKSRIGEILEGMAIVIGYAEGDGSVIGFSDGYWGGQPIIIGYTKGKKSLVGRNMRNGSITIGYTEGKGSLVGEDVEDNSIAIGFEQGKFVMKGKKINRKIDKERLSKRMKELKKKLEVLKVLEEFDLSTEGNKKIDLKKWAEEIKSSKGEKNKKIDKMVEAALVLKKTRKVSIGGKQFLPFDKNSVIVDILKLAYDIITENGFKVENERMLEILKNAKVI